ncbi:MAG: alpha/beta fold hydrolase [Rhodospirillaceae bacterium]|nr:alpha/beta fold hydrolase [Rhodospirillaceae bacterium]MBT6087651.1 alpha/beta fold hydrolase [Rhodospirillaceae bacterium]MBT6610232.1 alpha/beta fold hydrolase [Rhodospirillaceae bacterium]MBT7511844.1 alpha/beta fold hydrolase [Rhodospirillaceae bacterium]
MIDALEETAKVIQTPCGDGHMVWHLWGKGAPLVLLHGGSGSWTHWARNIPALSQRFRLLVADLPGLGDSDEPTVPYDSTNYPASTARLAAIVQTGVDAILGDDASFHLCGFSFGSIIGTYLAARAGQRVKTLTLAGSAAFGLPWDGLNGNLKGMTNEMTEAERIEIQRHNLSIIMMAGLVGEDAARMQLRNVERARVRSHGIGDTDL